MDLHDSCETIVDIPQSPHTTSVNMNNTCNNNKRGTTRVLRLAIHGVTLHSHSVALTPSHVNAPTLTRTLLHCRTLSHVRSSTHTLSPSRLHSLLHAATRSHNVQRVHVHTLIVSHTHTDAALLSDTITLAHLHTFILAHETVTLSEGRVVTLSQSQILAFRIREIPWTLTTLS